MDVNRILLELSMLLARVEQNGWNVRAGCLKVLLLYVATGTLIYSERKRERERERKREREGER